MSDEITSEELDAIEARVDAATKSCCGRPPFVAQIAELDAVDDQRRIVSPTGRGEPLVPLGVNARRGR